MEHKKKIIFYYPDCYVGGVEMAILNLAKRIYKDYDLFLFYRSFSDLKLAAEFRKYLILHNIGGMKPEDSCDVLIYCSLWNEKIDACEFVKAKKRILWAHAIIPKGNNKFYSLNTISKIDHIVVVSEATKKSIPFQLYNKKFNNSNVSVIHNILNTEEIKEKSMVTAPDIDLAKDLNICTVARISHEKGWMRIRFLCKELQKRKIDFKWFIIGEGYVPEQVHRIYLILKDIPQIEFLGKMLNPFPVVKQMDYLALLSDYESWGLVITEAKILGVPILVSDFDAAFEQVEHKVNGLIIPKKEPKKYRKLVKLAIKNKIKYKRNLKNFDYEEINKTSLEKWRKIFNS